ncbi:hypothetical protein BDZ89DRAFT_1071362 [Hymenopellis radicata]|nr:hypothetical protein BDZ89DRAFT_1071362 [Hymenopellis radicata]
MKLAALPLQLPPHRALTLHINNYISIGATGAVFGASVGPLDMVIKTIPPGWQGKSDLCHEAHMYDVLASLQGRVLPRMVGFFEGEGWTMLILEHCGKKVTDLDISQEQRRILWQYACEIHAKRVLHADLELRNLVVSRSGDVHIINYAFSKGGHKCNGDSCEELREFRRLLGLT